MQCTTSYQAGYEYRNEEGNLNINIKGLNINYICEGEGESIVLLHGWGSNITLFRAMTELLKTKYKVIAPDMPGFGLSDEPKEPWCVSDYVDFIIEFLKELGITKASFLGHSFGGRVIIKFFERDNLPFEIDKIILADSAGVKPKKTFKQKMKIKTYKMGKKILGSPIIKKLMPDALSKMQSKSGSADYRAASPMMRQTMVRVVNEDLTHIFPKVSPPTLLIWGENDTATPVSDAILMEQMMPDAGKVILKGCGHYSFLDDMYTFHRVLASFMNI